MKTMRKHAVLSAWFAALGAVGGRAPLLPGDRIHDEAPSLHKRDNKAEMSLRNAAALKRARKEGRRAAQAKRNG